MNRRWSWADPLAAVLLALPALWPLLRAGFFVSDDGLFHVYRIAALADAWGHGVLYPRLFPTFGFGYGQAVLNFYAPLAYVPAALLTTLGIGPGAAAEITIALGFVLAALAAYSFVRSLWGPWAGVLAAVAYTYFPYHLADVYVRGAIPEHMAFVWPPIILWAYAAAFREDGPAWRPLLWGGLAWAGLAYTHNLTALLMTVPWVAHVLVMAAWTGRWRRLGAAIGSVVVGAGLSAPLWLPFLAESRYVGLALGPSDGYRQHLAPPALVLQSRLLYQYRGPTSGPADHPLSWLMGLLFGAVLALSIWQLASGRRPKGLPILGFGLALMAISALMTTTLSLPVWRLLQPILANLQYPWRFLVLTALAAAIVAGALPSLVRGGRVAVAGGGLALLLLALIIQPLLAVPVQPLAIDPADAWSPDRMWREDAAAGQVGATWTGEFLPLTVREQRWALGRPPETPRDGPALAARPSVRIERLGYDRIELAIQAAEPLTVRLHQFHLPMWQAQVNGERVPTFPSGDLGLVSTDIKPGTNRLSFRFGPSLAWVVASVLASLAAGAWIYLAWRIRFADRRLAWAGLGLAALVLGLILNGLGVGQRAEVPRPVGAALGDVALLVGYDATPARGADALDVTLYWFALRETSQDYKTFVHLLGADGGVLAQHDGDPVGGYTPTTRWLPGELIADRHRVPRPPNLPPGAYRLKAGMYQPEPLRNLAPDPPTPDGRVDLGLIDLPQP